MRCVTFKKYSGIYRPPEGYLRPKDRAGRLFRFGSLSTKASDAAYASTLASQQTCRFICAVRRNLALRLWKEGAACIRHPYHEVRRRSFFGHSGSAGEEFNHSDRSRRQPPDFSVCRVGGTSPIQLADCSGDSWAGDRPCLVGFILLPGPKRHRPVDSLEATRSLCRL